MYLGLAVAPATWYNRLSTEIKGFQKRIDHHRRFIKPVRITYIDRIVFLQTLPIKSSGFSFKTKDFSCFYLR